MNTNSLIKKNLLLILIFFFVSCSDEPEQDTITFPTVEVDSPIYDTSVVPRYDDGLIRLDRFPGEKGGYWSSPSTYSLVEDGQDIEFQENGLLVNIEDAPDAAPFLPWSLALYKSRQQDELKSDPLLKACISPGGPRHLMDRDGFRIIQDRNLNRIYILFAGANMNWRVIFMDGREPPNPEEVTGTYYGHSTGRWIDDTLVVESSGFTERFWFSNGGLPHSDELRLIERFTRESYEKLTYEVTINDPLTYTRPWTSTWNLSWIEDEDIQQDFCEDNRQIARSY